MIRAFLTESADSNEMSVYQIAEKISIFAHLDVFYGMTAYAFHSWTSDFHGIIKH